MGHFFFTKNCHFGDLEAPFWVPWVTILVIQGSTGTPNRHLEVQVSIFIDLRIIWGLSWDPPWAPFCDFSVILGAKIGDSFQVHVFGDPGMEMMPECSVCMCCEHSKNNCYRDISLFTNLLSRGMVLGTILVYFGDLGTTFSDFWGPWRQAWNFMIFQGYP